MTEYDERTKESTVARFPISEVAEEKNYKRVNMKAAKPEDIGLTDEEIQIADSEEVEIWQKEYA